MNVVSTITTLTALQIRPQITDGVLEVTRRQIQKYLGGVIEGTSRLGRPDGLVSDDEENVLRTRDVGT